MQEYLREVRLAVRKRVQSGKSCRSIADAAGLTEQAISALFYDARASDDTIGRLLGFLANEKKAGQAKVDEITSGLYENRITRHKRSEAAHYRYCLALWTELTIQYGIQSTHPRLWWTEPVEAKRAHEAKMEIQAKRALLALYPMKQRGRLPDSQPYFKWKERLTGIKPSYRSADTPPS